MNRKRHMFNLLYGVAEAVYLEHCYGNPFDFLYGRQDGFTMIETVRWIMLFLPVWVTGLSQYDEAYCEMGLTAYRYHTLMRWWRILNVRIVSYIAEAYIALIIMLAVLEKFHLSLDDFKILGIITVHVFGLFALGSWIQLLSGNTILSGVLWILIEILGQRLIFDVGISPQYVFSAWGFLCFSGSLYGTEGYTAFLAAGIQIGLLVSIFISCTGVKAILLSRRWSNEKND